MVEMQNNTPDVSEWNDRDWRWFNAFSLIFAIVVGGGAIILGIYIFLGFGFGLIPSDPSTAYL